MTVTSTRIRLINNPKLYAIASVTLNHELIINDIMIYQKDYGLYVHLPNTVYAEKNNQSTIVPTENLYKEIKRKIFEKIGELKNS